MNEDGKVGQQIALVVDHLLDLLESSSNPAIGHEAPPRQPLPANH